MSKPFIFGRKEITCGYCKRTLPKKFCKRHSPKMVIRKVVYVRKEQS